MRGRLPGLSCRAQGTMLCCMAHMAPGDRMLRLAMRVGFPHGDPVHRDPKVPYRARMAEQVDAADLKSAGHCGCAGSTPAPGTTRQAGAVQLRIVCHASVVTSGGRRRRTAWIRECEGIDRKSSGQVQIPPARRSARNPNIQSTDRSQGMDARHRVEGIAWRAHLDHEGMQTYFRWSGQSGETSASEHGRRQANRC